MHKKDPVLLTLRNSLELFDSIAGSVWKFFSEFALYIHTQFSVFYEGIMHKLYTRSRNEKGIVTAYTVALNTSLTQTYVLLLRKFLTNCKIRGGKSERMAVG